MRLGISAGLAALAVFGAGSAFAADAYGNFKHFCLDTHGDKAAALSFAGAAGWTVADKDAVKIPSTGAFTFKDVAVRVSATDKAMLMVGSGEGAMGGKQTPADLCMLVGPTEAEAFTKTGAWVGLPAIATMNIPEGATTAKMTIYMFNDTPAGRTPLDATKTKPDGGVATPVTMVMTMDVGSTAGMLGYIIIKPAP